eukprot:1147098-Pelagomonas_calceolata.AAC.3
MGTKALEEIGAGDQGHMFGYATDETPELMPLTHMIATNLGKKLTDVRKDGTCPWLRPDGKTQVSVSPQVFNAGVCRPNDDGGRRLGLIQFLSILAVLV